MYPPFQRTSNSSCARRLDACVSAQTRGLPPHDHRLHFLHALLRPYCVCVCVAFSWHLGQITSTSMKYSLLLCMALDQYLANDPSPLGRTTRCPCAQHGSVYAHTLPRSSLQPHQSARPICPAALLWRRLVFCEARHIWPASPRNAYH